MNLCKQVQESCDRLLQRLAKGCSHPKGLSSISCSPYDTAWVSMIAKPAGEESRPQWLFPSSFSYLLANQSPDGGWRGNSASNVDHILNTMAALLSLIRHRSSLDCRKVLPSEECDLDERIARATAFLRATFQATDYAAADRVGLELLVPAHQRLLQEEGVVLDFPSATHLNQLRMAKLARFSPELIYGRAATTLTHSLEAFIGIIDFDRIRHRLNSGSMLASPASTAAYLIYASEWDEAAEAYLRDTIEHGVGQGSGAVPSAFPTTIFEVAWVTSTLLQYEVVLSDGGKQCLQVVVQYLKNVYERQNGVVGWAPSLIADADDTARCVLTLNLAGCTARPDHLIAQFKADDYFRTYPGERDPSISTNCNVLAAMLYAAEPQQYIVDIERTLRFLCREHNAGPLQDKWNTSAMYPRMLFTTVLARTIKLWADGPLIPLPNDCIQMALIILNTLLQRTLQQQDSKTGSWQGSVEITAYAVLTLAAVSNSPVGSVAVEQLRIGTFYGRAFLEANFHRWDKGDPVWIEKVLFNSPLLCSGFCIAALQAPTFTAAVPITQPGTAVVNVPTSILERFRQFYSRLPLLAGEPTWQLTLSLNEAGLWYPQLETQRHSIFPRDDMSPDKYLEYIPQTWTLCNARNGHAMEPGLMWEMMMISMLNYQVDEFLESVVGGCTTADVNLVRDIIHRRCNAEQHEVRTQDSSPSSMSLKNEGTGTAEREAVHAQSSEPTPPDSPLASTTPSHKLSHVDRILHQFIRYVLAHPAVVRSAPCARRTLARELETFLQAHLTDLVTSQQLQPGGMRQVLLAPPSSYFTWVHTTSADHTSCPYSFHFLAALIAHYHEPRSRTDHGEIKSPKPTFHGSRQRYLAETLCRHLATMCRQYNDYGSIQRDCEEGNLNSVNFPEFWETKQDEQTVPAEEQEQERTPTQTPTEESVKKELIWLAEYERSCCMGALERLVRETGLADRTARIVRTFVDVTDLYGQIYMARDIASRVR